LVSRRRAQAIHPLPKRKPAKRFFTPSARRTLSFKYSRKGVLGDVAVSRIWDALKQAQRLRALAEGRESPSSSVPANASINALDHVENDLDRRDDGRDDRRKDLRHAHTSILLVYGSGADTQPFHEEAETIDANDEGCLLLLETVVAFGQRLFLINMRTQAEQECKVVHVGKRVDGKTRIGLAFLASAPNFWRAS
jgi:hypothetical protein